MEPMADSKQPRPGQVTLAGWLVVAGSLAALVGAYERITNLHSIDTRESVRRMLAEPPLAGSGVELGTVLDVLHALALVTGACATAAAILGWQVLRRDRRARLALTIVAVPLLLAGMADSGFYSTIAAVSVVLLWVPQSRDWFDGVQRSAPPPASQQMPQQQMPQQQMPPPSRPAAPPPPARVQQGRPAAYAPVGRRPAAVVWAAVLTWVFCALTTLLMIGSALVVARDPHAVMQEAFQRDPSLADQGVSEHLLVVTMWVMVAVVIACCVGASVAAVLLWRRVAAARVALLCFVVPALVVTLMMTLAAAPFVVGLAGSVTTLALLMRPEVRAWLARR